MTWSTVLGYVLGAGGIGSLVIGLYKARPEAHKVRAEAVQVLSASAVSIVQGVENELRSLRSEVDKLKQRDDEREKRDDLQDRRLLVHERWDQKVADKLRDLGAPVEDPPPLYPATG